MITTIITFIIVFGILVVVHEFGHYYVAKKSGILVREFSIGMGPKIVEIHSKNKTTFTIRILPIGGYVRMAGMDDQDDLRVGQQVTLHLDANQVVSQIDTTNSDMANSQVVIEITEFDLLDKMQISGYINGDDTTIKTFDVSKSASVIEENGTQIQVAPREVQYNSVSVWKRMLTNFAGPFNNFVLAIVTFTLVGILQGAVPSNSNQVMVVRGDVAAKAGLKDHDYIEKVNNHLTSTWSELSNEISSHPNQTVNLTVKQGATTKHIKIKPKAVKQGKQTIGLIGVQNVPTSKISSRILYGFTATWNMTKNLFGALGQLLTGFSLNDLGGPVAIYATTSQAAKMGINSVLYLLAFLSLNLGIMNLLPIPALDGGKILLNIIEAIRRKPLNPAFENYVTLAGFAFLMILMFLVTWNDINRYFIK